MKLPEPPTLRGLNDADPDDRNHVTFNWLRSYVEATGIRDRPAMTRHGLEYSVFFELYRPIVRAITARSTVMFAAVPDVPTAFYGWAAFEGDLLHYVYVKPRWRRLGIASWLLRDFLKLPVTYTHRTRDGMRLPVPEAWTYAPMRRFAEAA